MSFLAAPSSSRSLVVGWLVGRYRDICEKVTFTRVHEYQIVTIATISTAVTVVTVVTVMKKI